MGNGFPSGPSLNDLRSSRGRRRSQRGSIAAEVEPDHDWPVPTPTRVFLGSKMEMVDKQVFLAICEPKGIEVHEMHKADDSFKLFPAPFGQ